MQRRWASIFLSLEEKCCSVCKPVSAMAWGEGEREREGRKKRLKSWTPGKNSLPHQSLSAVQENTNRNAKCVLSPFHAEIFRSSCFVSSTKFCCCIPHSHTPLRKLLPCSNHLGDQRSCFWMIWYVFFLNYYSVHHATRMPQLGECVWKDQWPARTLWLVPHNAAIQSSSVRAESKLGFSDLNTQTSLCSSKRRAFTACELWRDGNMGRNRAV